MVELYESGELCYCSELAFNLMGVITNVMYSSCHGYIIMMRHYMNQYYLVHTFYSAEIIGWCSYCVLVGVFLVVKVFYYY